MAGRRSRGRLNELDELLKRSAEAPRPREAARASDALDDEVRLFRSAMHDAVPLASPPRHVPPQPRVAPLPVQSYLDDHAVLQEAGADPAGREDFYDTGEEEAYLRPGMDPGVLRKLRRLQWKIQAEVSLRRLTQDEARETLALFLRECLDHGYRCVRVIHGKGMQSPNREPVLKRKVKVWLARRDEVLAFAQAPPAAGGGGALLVLLKSR